MTHPFHPLAGKEFVLLECGAPRGHDTVWYRDDAGRLRGFPAAWTSLLEPDPWLVVSAGRASFRLEDLLSVVELVEGLGRGER